MGISTRTKAKARRLYEYDGLSEESIAEIIEVSRQSIAGWKRKAEKAGDPWVKGKYSQDLYEKEQAAKVRAVEAAGWNEGRVLAELGLIAGSDIRDFLEVQPDGSVQMKDLKKLGDKGRVIKSIKTRKTMRKDGRGADADKLEETTTEIQVWDKPAALTKIGEHLGLFRSEGEKALEAGVFAFYRAQLAAKRARA